MFWKSEFMTRSKMQREDWIATVLLSPDEDDQAESDHKLTNAMCSVSVFYFPPEDDEDGPTFKDRALECLFKGIDTFCVWECCYPWVRLKGWVSFVVFDPFIELFITLCIVVNTLFMALDHHDMDRDMEKALKSGNYVISPTCKYSII